MRLTTTVAASAVPGTGCSVGATAVAESSELNGPDPVIVKTGCVTVGSPCSFTVTSAYEPDSRRLVVRVDGQSDREQLRYDSAEFKPQFTTTTDYSVGVIVTNGIGSKTATLSGQHIDKPLCSSAPDDINTSIGHQHQHRSASRRHGPLHHVFARGWTPSVECDKFDWSFGDGGTSTEMVPTHTSTTAPAHTPSR